MGKQLALTRSQWEERIAQAARAAGATGATPSKLKPPKPGSAGAPVFAGALASLLENGGIVAVPKGKTIRYFSREYAPPPPAEQFRRDVLSRLSHGTVWLEDALAGRGAKSGEKREWLADLAGRGEIRKVNVATSARSQKTGYASPSDGPAPVALPGWADIESAGRMLASARADQTVGFEQLADRLDLAPLVIKTAVMQRIELRGGLQLVRGEARETRDPATAGLESGGDVYYRFRFLD